MLEQTVKYGSCFFPRPVASRSVAISRRLLLLLALGCLLLLTPRAAFARMELQQGGRIALVTSADDLPANAQLTLNGEAAEALNAVFNVSAFQAGLPVGTARVHTYFYEPAP